MRFRAATVFLWIIAGLVAASARFSAAQTAAVQTTLLQTAVPAARTSVSMTVTPSGQMAILLGKKQIADGRFYLFHYENRPLDADELPLVQKSLTASQDSAAHAVITEKYVNCTAIYDLALDGEDLHIRLHLQNQDPVKTIKRVNLQGLTFHFDRSADGTLHSWHWTYVDAHGTGIFHPSVTEPIGVVYARDEKFGLSMFSTTEFDRQSLFNAVFTQNGIIPADSQLQMFTTQQVPPGQAIDVDMNLRISADTSMRHLLGAYKTLYDTRNPKLLYIPDNRPLASFTGVGDAKTVTRTNPYGFTGRIFRFDSAAAVNAYVRLIAPALQQKNALGIIFWSPGGYREPMYPPDFDVFPPEVQRNIPALVNGFKRRGLRVGLCARCGDGVTREPGKDPVMRRLQADNAQDMQELLQRFNHAMDMGFDLFYLDSFGGDELNDLAVLKQIRQFVGADVQLYSENCTDMTLPYAGRYCEWKGNTLTWTSFDQYDELRYLCPDSTWLCIAKYGRPIPPEVLKMGLVPLVDGARSNLLPVMPRGRVGP